MAKKSKRTYEDVKKAAAEQSAQLVSAGQEIGELPEVKNPERKLIASGSLKSFCESYFPGVFYRAWSPDHLKVIDKIETAINTGGLFALATMRGFGKSVLCQTAVTWAAITGKRPFICLIASSMERGRDLLETIKIWLETNDLLLEDFPEVCYPIRKLERITHRQKGQKYNGEHTRIEWGSDRIVLPTIPGAASSAVVISCSGMKGSELRGQHYARTDGTIVRPSLFLADDPQTTDSAMSDSQCEKREQAMSADVLGMAGPGEKIAGLMTCTVIRAGDMADRMVSREIHPEWHGEKMKMIYTFPDNKALWDKYNEMRTESLRNDGDGANATEFYRQNREEMDRGAKVAWAARYNEDELSAVQHAMNLMFRDEAAFYAEYQNEPVQYTDETVLLTPEQIFSKINNFSVDFIPLSCHYISIMVDVQKKCLYYVVTAWEDNFTGYVVNYGAWPDPKRERFLLREITDTIQSRFPNMGGEGQIYNALSTLTDLIVGRVYHREDGMEMRCSKCLIDANWGDYTDVVYNFCRQSQYSSVLLPSHGKFVGASSIPFSEYRKQRGDQVGHHWRIPNIIGKRAVRHVVIDTNYWKSFVYERLSAAMGDPGCISLWGREPRRHQMFAEHVTSEFCVPVTANQGQGTRTVNEWKLRASRPDNHLFDCLVGCAVGASILGCQLTEFKTERRVSKKIKLSELQ